MAPNDTHSNIVLIGMPGVGKSTAGVLLAKALKRPFLDTDLVIQAQTGRYLQEIIESDGMEAFLDQEAAVICSLQIEGTVIATGGSVVYRDAAMRHLAHHGHIFFLDVPCAVLEARLRDIATRGIACKPGQSICDLYTERLPLYQRYAEVTIPADCGSIEDTVTRLVAIAVRG